MICTAAGVRVRRRRDSHHGMEAGGVAALAVGVLFGVVAVLTKLVMHVLDS